MSSRSSRGSTPIDGGPSQASEAAEEALLGEIDSLQKRQTMLETRIAQFALEQFNLKGKASSSTLKDLAAQLATAQTEEIEVSATLAQKRKDLVALLKLRRAPSGTRHSASVAPGILSASAPQVEAHRADTTSPSPLSTSNRESTRRRGTQVTPSDPLDVANSAARQRLLKRQSFPTPPSASEQPLNVSQERALAMKINEKAARRDERRRRTKEEPGSPTSHALERTSHVPSSSGRHHKSPSSSGQNLLSTSNPAITSAPLQASNSGGATAASSVAPSHALSDSGKRLSSAASAAPSGGDDLVLPAKTGYQDVLSEEETPTRVDMYPELTKAIQGIEVQYSNLRFGQPIGTGCYGEVFAATLDGKPVAVKVMTTSSTPSLRKAFVREVEALRMLRDHPNIVRLVGASLYPHWCIVMQLAHGGSLHDLLYTRRVSLTLEQALRIGRDVADALRYLHGLKTPIIHRDVTSRNVLLNAVGGSIPSPLPGGARQVDSAVQYQALLSDFGIARTKKGSRSADQLSPTGPRRFRAPEVTHKGPDGRYHYSRRVDVYMFGTVLFELLYAREPWPQDLPDERIVQQRISGLLPPLPEMTASGQAVPLELRSVISATWNEEPKLRPNIGAVSKLLELLYRRVRPSSRKGTNSATPEP